jgi:hypothetical protein
MPGEEANHRMQEWLEHEEPLICPLHHIVAIGDAYDLGDEMTRVQTHTDLLARNL